MLNFLTFRYSNAGWSKDNKYCNRDYAFFDLPSTNFVLYPQLIGNCTCGINIQIAEQYDHTIRNNGEKGSMPNANLYYSKSFSNVWLNDWIKSTEPVIGGAICYDGWFTSSGANCGGHVQFIYDVDLVNNKILIGESLYKSKAYNTRWLPLPKPGEEVFLFSGYKFVCQGFLKAPYSIDRRVKRNTSLNQVDILVNELRVRKSPNGQLYDGQYFLPGLYNVLEIKEEGNLTWAKLFEDIWVGLDSRYTKFYESESKVDWKAMYESAMEENRSLKEKINKAKEILE